jgi:hypothetical protein
VLGEIGRNIAGRAAYATTARCHLGRLERSRASCLYASGRLAGGSFSGFGDLSTANARQNMAATIPPDVRVTPTKAAESIVRLATLPPDGPSGRFFTGEREIPW